MAKLNYSSLQSQMILQKSFYVDLVFNKYLLLLSMLKKAVLLNCFVETMIHLRFLVVY